MKKVLSIIPVLFLLFGTVAMAADVVMIVNNGAGVEKLDKQTAQNIFLGKKAKWDSGEKIVPAVLAEGQAHEAFLKDVVKKTPSQFKTFWKKAVFTGTGSAPKSFKTGEEVVKFVASTKGAVGYVAASVPCEGVKTIALTE